MSYTSYVICGTPRSGSTLLCEMLRATGVAGRPHSYYREQDLGYWAAQWGMPAIADTDSAAFDRAYLATLLREGDGGTGRFGIRIMWGSMAGASRRLGRATGTVVDIAEQFDAVFGPTLFIHLSRLDKLAQAISLVRAEQSGLWHLAADGSVLEGGASPQPVHYDPDRIAAILGELESDDAAWQDFFAMRDIQPRRIIYETMTAAPQAALADVLSDLGRDPTNAASIPTRTAKMGDGTNRQWAERFRSEHGL